MGTKLTKAQKAALAHVVETGFVERRCGFGVTPSNISYILSGSTWKGVQ